MSLRGRPPGSVRRPTRKNINVFVLPSTHVLLRALAEAQGATIGGLVDELVAAEAERVGIRLGLSA